MIGAKPFRITNGEKFRWMDAGFSNKLEVGRRAFESGAREPLAVHQGKQCRPPVERLPGPSNRPTDRGVPRADNQRTLRPASSRDSVIIESERDAA